MSDLPIGWHMVQAAELFGFITSGSRGWAAHYSDSGAKFIRVQNVRRGLIDLDLQDVQHVRPPANAEGARTRLQAGDVVITITADLGRVGLIPENIGEAYVNQHVALARPLDVRMAPFLAWFMVSADAQEQLGLLDRGATRAGLGLKDIAAIRIPLPPLAEQRRIVMRIEALFARTRRARADLERIAPLIDQYCRQLVSAVTSGCRGTERRIADVAEVVTGTTPATKERSHYGGSTPFIKPTDLDAGYDVIGAREGLTASGLSCSRPVPAGSTLVTCIGATIGKTGFARVACATNQQINALVPDTSVVEPRWLYWIAISPDFQDQILTNASATTLPIINKSRFEALRLNVPPMDEQEKAIALLEAQIPRAGLAEREAARALALLDHLEQAILAKAFRGDLVPQDTGDEPATALLARLQRPATSQRKRRMKEAMPA